MSAQLSIIGNLGKNAEVKTNKETGNEFTVFSVGSNQTFTDKKTKEKITKTTWLNCIMNGSTIAQYLKKGDLVHILSGSIEVKPFQKQDDSLGASLNIPFS